MLTVAAPAFGAAVPVDANRKVESTALRADRTTGRAWVDVTLAKRFLSGREVRQQGSRLSVAVPELSFDAATGNIELVSGDRRVLCGTLDGNNAIRTTGACQVTAKIEPTSVDTGFGTAQRDQLVVAVTPR